MAELDSSDDSDDGVDALKSLKVSEHKEYKSQHQDNKLAPTSVRSKIESIKNDSDDEKIANFGSSNANTYSAESKQQPTHISTSQMAEMKKFLNKSCNLSDPPLCCYVERYKVGYMMQPLYLCYMEGQQNHNSRFLMSAKKKMSSKTSYFLLSLEQDPNENDRGNDAILGKVRGNAVGSQYLVTDAGMSLQKAVSPSSLRQVAATR